MAMNELLDECEMVSVVCDPPPFSPSFVCGCACVFPFPPPPLSHSATITPLGCGGFHALYKHSFIHSFITSTRPDSRKEEEEEEKLAVNRASCALDAVYAKVQTNT